MNQLFGIFVPFEGPCGADQHNPGLVLIELTSFCILDHGLGLKVAPKPAEPQSENGLSPGGSEGAPDEEEADEGPIKVVRAVYAFSGASEDEVCG